MRLLNTETKRLEEFGVNPPDYAILSHCWFNEEVTFQDMSRSDVEEMKGYAKLSAACDMACRLGYLYLWMDTCCIDKSSSAELSEAINSMYSWYKSAGLCITYLNDVDGDIKGSRWFKRGWTLQELIAPEDVIFADRNWNIVGMKSSLASLLANITGIDEDVLLTGNMEGLSIAKRMSWAANRDTTRREDRAYSLMGIFGVNMPPIYGEGDKAFIRLQEEIMKKSNDQSIFTWSWNGDLDGHRTQDMAFLASSPQGFEKMNDVVRIPFSRFDDILGVTGLDIDSTVTNCGVRIRLPVQPTSMADIYRAFLACGRSDDSTLFCIYLRKISTHQYTRIHLLHRSNLREIPVNKIELSNIAADDFIFINTHEPTQMTLVTSRSRIRKVEIDIKPLCEMLRKRNFAIFGQSWNKKIQSTQYTFRYGHGSNLKEQEHSVVMENVLGNMEFMLVMTLRRASGRRPCVSIRAVSFEHNKLVPARTHERSPVDIYRAWRNRVGPNGSRDFSRFAEVKLSTGETIKVVMVRAQGHARARALNEDWEGWTVMLDPRSEGVKALE